MLKRRRSGGTHRNTVIQAAAAACRSFAAYQSRFFRFDRRNGWRGWENWLTVDICRRLDSDDIHPFERYPTSRERRHFDIFVSGEPPLAVEIKVNYIDDEEALGKKKLPDRVLDDREKLDSIKESMGRLILVSTCFESRNSAESYPARVAAAIASDFPHWHAEWHDCSVPGNGSNKLLALSRPARQKRRGKDSPQVNEN
jgi:hypothetical protein